MNETPRSILIVDDMETNRALLAKILSKENFNLNTVSCGQQALEFCQSNSVDLCLLDINMPDMDGFELASLLRNQEHTRHIRIIFVTAVRNDRNSLLTALKLGAIDYIEKPIDREVLISKIRTHLESSYNEKLLVHKNKELALSSVVFNEGSDGILITDSHQTIIKVNPAFTKITGYSEEEVIGKSPKILSSGHHNRIFYDEMWTSLAENKRWSGEIWNKHKDGNIFPEWQTITAVTDESDTITHYIATFSDLSHHHFQEEKIERLVHYDDLTNLPNRSLFTQYLNSSIVKLKRENAQGALLFIDINDIKKINDTLGHSFGDKVILAFSEKLTELTHSNAIVARFGGDEFVIWLESNNDNQQTFFDTVRTLAQAIHHNFSEPLYVDIHTIMLSSSIGISMYPDDATQDVDLIRKADIAMYQAKNQGSSNSQFFIKEMEQQAVKNLQIETELRNALSNNSLTLNYQPQVDINSGQVIGAEALLRWKHQQLGFISPADFIPIAEKSGLIIDVGNQVLKNACNQIKQWEDKGLFEQLKTISVNISSLHFVYPSFIQTLEKIIDETGISPCHLDIELTETALINDHETVIQHLHDIKHLGCRISIDDFGTGYSSLQYLSVFPLDVLKIDKCFIDDIEHKTANKAITNAIIALANMLNAEVIAEGIEDKKQLELLRSAGCSIYQGYLYSPAITPDEFESHITILPETKSQQL